MRQQNKSGMIILILLIVVVLLLGIVLYAFLVRPAFTGYIIDKQVEAYNQAQIDILNAIITQIQQNGFVQIPVGNETLDLVPR